MLQGESQPPGWLLALLQIPDTHLSHALGIAYLSDFYFLWISLSVAGGDISTYGPWVTSGL